ncbi:MAG: hypothetical protein WCV84_05395 [Patescibacteria group bacterium]
MQNENNDETLAHSKEAETILEGLLTGDIEHSLLTARHITNGEIVIPFEQAMRFFREHDDMSDANALVLLGIAGVSGKIQEADDEFHVLKRSEDILARVKKEDPAMYARVDAQ